MESRLWRGRFDWGLFDRGLEFLFSHEDSMDLFWRFSTRTGDVSISEWTVECWSQLIQHSILESIGRWWNTFTTPIKYIDAIYLCAELHDILVTHCWFRQYSANWENLVRLEPSSLLSYLLPIFHLFPRRKRPLHRLQRRFHIWAQTFFGNIGLDSVEHHEINQWSKHTVGLKVFRITNTLNRPKNFALESDLHVRTELVVIDERLEHSRHPLLQ